MTLWFRVNLSIEVPQGAIIGHYTVPYFFPKDLLSVSLINPASRASSLDSLVFLAGYY